MQRTTLTTLRVAFERLARARRRILIGILLLAPLTPRQEAVAPEAGRAVPAAVEAGGRRVAHLLVPATATNAVPGPAAGRGRNR